MQVETARDFPIEHRRPKKFLISGGAGFLGSHLCRHFLDWQVDESGSFASSNRIFCLDNMSKGRDNIDDLVDKPTFQVISRSFGRESLDVPILDDIGYILHFASYPSPKDHKRLPIETLMADTFGTMHMVEMAFKKQAVFLLASTGHIDLESNPTEPTGIYCEGKRWAEAYTMAHHRCFGTETRIVRMFNSYGPGMRVDDGRVVPTFIVKALRGERLTIMGGDQLMSLTYIDDMVDGIEKVLYGNISEPVELGDPRRINVYLLAKLIITLSGSNSKLEIVPQGVKDEKRPNLERAKSLGWNPKIGIEEGMARTIEYFRKIV